MLATILYTQIDIFGILILLIMFISLRGNKSQRKSTDEKLFRWLLLGNIIVLLADAGMWLIDYQTFDGARLLNYSITVLYFALHPVLCMMWLMYCDFKLEGDFCGLRRRIKIYCIPAVIGVAIAVTAPFSGLIFTISPNNGYQRSPSFLIIILICGVYLAYAVILTLKKTRHSGLQSQQELYRYFLLFPLAPLGATILQVMFFGLSLIWISTALMFLMIFVTIQNRQIYTDALTGLYNRRYANQVLEHRIQHYRGQYILFVIMLDIDYFKQINDRYGHSTGDRALIQTAQILRQSCRDEFDLVARLGGDEFVIMGTRHLASEAEELQNEIRHQVSQFNSLASEPYHLSLSMGCATLDEVSPRTTDALISAADTKMYACKEEQKRLCWSI
ncbi:MAG: diguanylate cyclase [Angelakisella sp.]|nr:diguanylate cyclase [Angelakisella sp.]